MESSVTHDNHEYTTDKELDQGAACGIVLLKGSLHALGAYDVESNFVSFFSAKTVGNFLDTSFVLVTTVCTSGAVWAFIQGVASSSYTAMTIILFIVVYIGAVLRALAPRFFVASLVGPIFTFAAISSVVGVAGQNTSDGNVFDYNYLISFISSYLIGLIICLVINVLVFPDMAEPHLNQQFLNVLDSISELSHSILSAMCGNEITKEGFKKGQLARASLVSKIQGEFASITTTINQASAEIGYSYFSVSDYSRILNCCKGVATVLMSLNTSLNSDVWHRIVSCPEFTDEIAPAINQTDFTATCTQMFDEIKELLNKHDSTSARLSLRRNSKTSSCSVVNDKASDLKKMQPNSFFHLLGEVEEVEPTVSLHLKEQWNMVLEINFFILASEE
ncbi:hypothetical protein HK100_011206, partial [Physocladia obscura]